jgi:glycosyltransferase involved in cell wall biosynthesis
MTPVVSVPVGDMPDLLAGLPGCAVVPRDRARLARAVLAALAHGPDVALRRRAEQFSNARMAAETVDLYRRVLEGDAA